MPARGIDLNVTGEKNLINNIGFGSTSEVLNSRQIVSDSSIAFFQKIAKMYLLTFRTFWSNVCSPYSIAFEPSYSSITGFPVARPPGNELLVDCIVFPYFVGSNL